VLLFKVLLKCRFYINPRHTCANLKLSNLKLRKYGVDLYRICTSINIYI